MVSAWLAQGLRNVVHVAEYSRRYSQGILCAHARSILAAATKKHPYDYIITTSDDRQAQCGYHLLALR